MRVSSEQAYLEFFVSPDQFERLRTEIFSKPMITYFAVNSKVGHCSVHRDRRTQCTPDLRNVLWARRRLPGRARHQCQDRTHKRSHVGRLPVLGDHPAHRRRRPSVHGVEGLEQHKARAPRWFGHMVPLTNGGVVRRRDGRTRRLSCGANGRVRTHPSRQPPRLCTRSPTTGCW